MTAPHFPEDPKDSAYDSLEQHPDQRMETHPWRRFFARTVDFLTGGMTVLLMFSLVLGFVFPSIVPEYLTLMDNNIAAGFITYALWVPIEAMFISGIGTTPAKWVFGIRIVDRDDKRLTYKKALHRTTGVWALGEGLGIPVVTLITRIVAYRQLTREGITVWDEEIGSVVLHSPWGVGRAIGATAAVIVALMLVTAVAGGL